MKSSKRTKESELVLAKREIEVPTFVGMNKSLGEALSIIISDKEYHNILNSIQKSSDRKNEISNILTYYK